MSRPRQARPRNSFANVRLTANERQEMERSAADRGFQSVSEYIRHLHSAAVAECTPPEKATVSLAKTYPAKGVKSFLSTDLGEVFLGDSLCYLHSCATESSVDLVMTSPPFGLVRKKSYGNEDADRYCDWFRPFAEGFRRVLKPTGSLVIDIGGAWNPGTPTRSLYHFQLLIMLCRDYGFHLAQEHYWWSPSRLPGPAEWVNVRRIRVKDAVNCVWWLSPTPWPKATNRRVLAPYSASMLDLLKNGYKAKLRPSGHDISENFSKDNGGAVPPNLLALANTESNGRYQEFCRSEGHPIHPARFPEKLPEYFIRLLTDQGDLVVDPFAGSCVTGAAAERLGRRWVCCEMDKAYLEGASVRFAPPLGESDPQRPMAYTIHAPCSMQVDESRSPLAKDGGKKRPKFAAKGKKAAR